ncbi:hypothetical protein F945_02448 [Acinetobacter rudis CIP 110305]|uniref:Two-component system, OmpR family, response regulator AdeR n=2 Tax=Acinetobacter rudis TaxID=632955 RepID=S3NAN1_9GAMM|nr:hypothetical protein F945_02448 [Acinetobacter rudis CIP 110305]
MMTPSSFQFDHPGKTILVVEDDYDIGDIVENYLKKSDFHVIRAMNGLQALEIQASTTVDLIILDVKMPQMTGWDVLSTLRQNKSTPVIMLTALDQEVDKIVALRMGADDFVVKPFNPNELVARVQALLRRSSLTTQRQSQQTIIYKNIVINCETHHVSIKHQQHIQALNLTLTEYKILHLMAQYPNKVFTRHELMTQCLPDSDALERTVDSHVSKLRKKLEDQKLMNLLINVRGVGYRLDQVQ